MTVHPPTLLLCCTLTMLLSAGLMSLFGGSQRVYRGYGFWTLAQWLAALGLLLQLWRDGHPGVLPLAQLLLMQWPVLLLAGFRRFEPRRAARRLPAADGLVLALAYLPWLAAWLHGADPRWQAATSSLGMFWLLAYAAHSLRRLNGLPAGGAATPLLALLWLGGATHGLRLAGGLAGWTDSPALPLAAAAVELLSPLAMLYVGLVLTGERTQQEQAASQRRLRRLADLDALTDVPNRRHFHELAQQALANGRAAAGALLMIDIDHFKRINDLLGHRAGDQALREVARSMRQSLRLGDVAGRLGGDEFVALLPATSIHDAIAVADRIVLPLSVRSALPLSLSFGVVQVQAGESLDEALHRADQALYEAKRQGRNCAVVATGDDGRPVFTQSMPLGLVAM